MLSELVASDALLWEVAVRAAIASDPAAFSANVEDLERLTEADWWASLERYCTDRSVVLVDFDGTDGSVVAMVCVEISSDQPSALVTNLWVAPNLRRAGRGRFMMQAAERYARRQAATEIVLTVNPGQHGAEAFYRSLDFILNDGAAGALSKPLLEPKT